MTHQLELFSLEKSGEIHQLWPFISPSAISQPSHLRQLCQILHPHPKPSEHREDAQGDEAILGSVSFQGVTETTGNVQRGPMGMVYECLRYWGFKV